MTKSARSPILLVACLILFAVGSVSATPDYSPLSYSVGGSHNLDPGGYLTRTVDATEGDEVEFSFNGEGAPLECGIMFMDTFPNQEIPVNVTLSRITCIYYEFGLEGSCSFTIPETGDWVIIIYNLGQVQQTVSYRWTATFAGEQLAQISFWVAPPLLALLVVVAVRSWLKNRRQ